MKKKKYFCLQTPVKEHEIMIFCNSPGTDMFRLLYYVIQTYYKLERVCFSTGLAFPVMNSKNRPSLPAIIRIGTRGQCTSHTNDVSSLDLYMVCNRIPTFTCICMFFGVLLRFFHTFSSVVRQVAGYNSQRLGTAHTLPN